MEQYQVQIAVKRTIRQYRNGHKTISKTSMRELERVLRGLRGLRGLTKEKEPTACQQNRFM